MLGSQKSFFSLEFDDERRLLIQRSSSSSAPQQPMRKDIKMEFVHRWLMAQSRQRRLDHGRIK